MLKKQIQLTGHKNSVYALTYPITNVGDIPPQYFYSGAGDGWVVRWDLAQPDLGKLVAKVETQIFSLLFLEKQNHIVAGNMNGGMHFINLDAPNDTRNVQHHRLGVFGIQLFDNQLFSIGGGGLLTRWSLETFRTIESIQLSTKSLRSFDFSKERNEIAIGSSDGNIYFVDATSLDLKKVMENAHKPSVFAVKYIENGRFLLSGGRDAQLKLWALDEFSEENTFVKKTFLPHETVSAHWFTLNTITLNPTNPRIFATASRDKTIKIWQIQAHKPQGEKIQLLKVLDTIRDGCHTHSVNSLLWTPFENKLLSASDDRSIIVWESTS